jgi:hypothetical protein
MYKGEMVAEKFLCNPADLVNVAIILQYFTERYAIANPIKMCAPKIASVLTNSPSASNSLSDKGVEVGFSFSTSAGTKLDGP